ncbi:unnamed protein product, partial [Oppiella nova]
MSEIDIKRDGVLANLDDLVKNDLIPNEWKDTILNDVQKQNGPPIECPFSDAYYYGMSQKFRKSNKFSQTLSLRECLIKAIKVSNNTENVDKLLDNILSEKDLEKD